MSVITTQCFPPRMGGIENLVHALASALAAKGFAVEVFADGHGGAEEKAFDLAQPYPIWRVRGFKPWRRWWKARRLSQLIETRQCTNVIADSWKSLEHLEVVRHIPVVCLAHGSELPRQGIDRKARRIAAAYAKVTAVVANSRNTLLRVIRFFPDSTRLHVIYPGVARPPPVSPVLSAQITTELAGFAPKMISVARLEPRKGIDSVLRVLPRLVQRYPQLLYLIVGDGSQRTALEEMVTTAGMQAHVRFISAASDALRDGYLAASDLFVLPGRRVGDDVEGFGMAFVEAAWFALPALCGSAGGAAEAVVHEQTGLVCEGDDDESVYTAIDELLRDDARRQAFGAQARLRAEDFLWERILGKYLVLLKKNIEDGAG